MSSQRYDTVAIALHWVIAATILVNLGLGVWMSWAIRSPIAQSQAVTVFQIHKSLGLTVLVLSLLRLTWRFLYPPPPLATPLKRWERIVASVSHWLLYVLMIVIPLSGWLYVSAQWRGDAPFNIPTLWFGLFEVPHLFGLSDGSRALRQQAAALAFNVHGAMALAMVVLLLMHVGAALKHHLIQRDGVLVRMLPLLATTERSVTPAQMSQPTSRGMVAAGATLLIAVLFIGYGATVRLAPAEAVAPTGTAAVLQSLVAESEAGASVWQRDILRSELRFAGVHANRAFNGQFDEWQVAVHFDAQALEQSFVGAAIATASATDGVPLHDRSLPQAEWFDVAHHPYAIFRSTAIAPLAGDRYELSGTLTIKNHTVALAPLTLTTIDDKQLRISGIVELDRAAVDMGMESDPSGQYVSRVIEIQVDVIAVKP